MSNFILRLSEYVRAELIRALGPNHNQQLRLFFSGPPLEILDELFGSLVRDGEFLELEGAGSIKLPVFVLDAQAEDPDRLRSARCTPSFLVKVRTSECPVFLTLHPPNESSVLSLGSTTTLIGMSGEIQDWESWLDHPLIRALSEAGLKRIFGDSVPLRAKQALSFAIDEAWRADESFKDHRNAWQILRRLLDCEILQASCEETFLAILGLPACDQDQLGTPEHLRVLGRIADLLEQAALGPGLDQIQEQAGNELRLSLTEFREHLLARCRTASTFAWAPSQYYRPIEEFGVNSLPSWWRALTVETWNRLLDSSPELGPQEGLSVVFSNPLTPSVRGIPVLLRDRVEVNIHAPGNVDSVTVKIGRASGAKRLEQIASLELSPGESVAWCDDDVLSHDRSVRYQFEAVGYRSVTVKCIVLDRYGPGLSIYCRNATKITPFKAVRKKRDSQERRVDFECELALTGTGAHQLDLYSGRIVRLGDTIRTETGEKGEDRVSRPINRVDDHHAVCVVDAGEESVCYFEADPLGAGELLRYRIWITADDQVSTGAASEFDRLLIEHRASVNAGRVNARVQQTSSRLVDLQVWAIEDELSCYPLALGPDYLDCWRKPEWAARPVLSSHALMLDPRPPLNEFVVPAALMEARRAVLSHLRDDPNEPTNPIEMIRLGELMKNSTFAGSLTKYLGAYVEWLAADYASASWMDVIALHSEESTGKALRPTPYAILLTPLHPLRLAWQCQAQEVLKDALDKHALCPGASVLDPASFPDCMVLRCRTATGRLEDQAFLALANTSDYWSVLWNKDDMSTLGVGGTNTIFDSEFGVVIDGLTTGFGVQQVVRSIEEVSRLSSGKATLSVSIESDTTGSSSCNEGVYEWCEKSLGQDADPWHEAGPRSLQVHDHRSDSLHPEQASLASLTAATGAAVRWFTREERMSSAPADLAIVAHLGVASPAFQVEGLRSAIDPLGLARWRVRKQLAATGGEFVAEARVGTVPHLEDPAGVQGLLLQCIDKIESECARVFDSYLFAPRIPTLEYALNSARYCAVSSATIDAACFFRATQGAYLWDYELAPYSRRAGENSGYFLLAKKSETMVRAVQSAVQRIAPTSALDPRQVDSLLREISRRGMPTLKRLTGGGATSLGEIGMLVALRVLQTEFQEDPQGLGLAPVRDGDDVLTLIIPVDPFQSHFEEFHRAIRSGVGERPDMMIASIRFDVGKPLHLKLTMLEVKARADVLSTTDRGAALQQARYFAHFLGDVMERSQDLPLWGVAWRNLVASWLDYAFRVYGQLETFLHQQEWTGLHSSVLAALMDGSLTLEIDPRSRLIVVDRSNTSYPCDLDDDGFRETIVLSHADAYEVLATGGGRCVESMCSSLEHWDLFPTGLAPIETASMGPVVVTPPPTTTGEVANREQKGERGDSNAALPPPGPPVPKNASGSEESTSDAPEKGLKFRVGTTLAAFQPKDLSFFPGNTELNQLNVGIVGDLGTGKTQLIQSLLYQLRRHPEDNRNFPPRVLIFDYKKDYSKDQFVKATGARVVSPFEIPLNLFDTRDSTGQQNGWLQRSKFFSDVLDKIYSGIGAVQRERIKQAVREAYERSSAAGRMAPTIYDVFEAYRDNPGGQVDTPYSIMSDLVDGGYFVRDSEKVLPFSEFLDGVVVVDLASVGQDDKTKNMLVVIFLNLFYEHMLKIQKRPFHGHAPSLRHVDTMLLVDEADNIMSYEFDVLKKILLQGREFGVGVILASQYLSHFKTAHENYAEPLLTWFIHKVPTITVRELERIGLTHVDSDVADKVKKLACHECLYKTYDVAGEFMRGLPFFEIIEGQQ